MLQDLVRLTRDREMFVCALCLLLVSSATASVMPYQSVVAIQTLGLSASDYSMIVMATATISVGVSVLFGIVADWLGSRRMFAVIASAAGIAAHFAMVSWLSIPSFIVAHAVFLPVAATLFQQLFVALRIRCAGLPDSEISSTMTAARSLIAVSYAIVPPAMGIWLGLGASFGQIYSLGIVLYALCLGSLIITKETRLQPEPIETRAPVPGASPITVLLNVALPILFVCLLEAARRLSGIVFPLIVLGNAHGTLVDIGTLSGLIAVLEVVAILFWARKLKRYKKTTLLGLGGIVFSVYLATLWMVTSLIQIYLVIPILVLGSSALISINMAYLQSLFPRRIGLSTSLMAVTTFVGSGIASLTFFLSSGAGNYSSAALWAAALALFGGMCIFGISLLQRQGDVPRFGRN